MQSLKKIHAWAQMKVPLLIFDLTHIRGQRCGKFFDTVVLFYRHWAIIVHSEVRHSCLEI